MWGLWINFLMLPFQNIHSGLNGGGTGRTRAERESDGGRGWRWCRVWPWKSPPGGVVEGQQGAPTVHKACLVRDKRQAPGGPYGTIFTIRASLFSLGLRARACQENSMLAGLKVVLGSNVKGERRSPTGWATGSRGSSTFTSLLCGIVRNKKRVLIVWVI